MYTPRGACSRHDQGRCTPLRSILLLLLAWVAMPLASFAQLSPGGPVDFGNIPVGTPGTPITLTFSATVVTTVSAIVATTDGATGKDFNVSNQNCVGTMLPPASCQITVTFQPSVIGLRRGELMIVDGSSNVINRAALHGNGLGPQLVVSPSAAVATTSLTGIAPATVGPSSTTYDGNGNLLIDDAINGRILEQPAGGGSATVLATFPASPLSTLAIAGDGTLYFSSPTEGRIYALPPAGVAAPYSTGAVSLSEPTGIATDGFGFLYIVDTGNNRLVRVNLDAGSSNGTALTLTGLGTPLNGPTGLAIDAGDNAYIADTANNRIVEVNLRTAAASIYPVTGPALNAPHGVAVNAAGGLTIADTGNSRLVEATPSGAAFPLTLTGATLSSPMGITLLPTGDILVADTVAGLVQVTRSTTSLTFPTSTLVGTVDTVDGDLAVTAENTGSYSLQLPSATDPSSTGNAFFADSTSTCPITNSGSTGGPATQIAVGVACTYEFGFKPTVKGTNTATDTITATATGGTNATVNPTITLTGTGYVELSYFTLTVTPSTVNPGQATTLTVTAFNNDGSLDDTYTGTITLSSTDASVHLPALTYTFAAGENGTHVFSSTGPSPLTFNTLGDWTVTAVDTATIPGKTVTGTSNIVHVVTTPTVTLTSSVNPVDVNATTTLTATVASTFGTPSGSVTFLDGSTVLGTATLNASGVATLNVSFSTPGQHPLTASYPGSGFFQAATSATLIETVNDFTPSIILTSSVNPVMLNGSTKLTATLTSTSGTPTGTVTFLDGTTVLGTGTLTNGVTTLNVSFSTVGQHTLTVSYPGNGPFEAGTSAPFIEVVGDFSLTLASTSPTSATVILGGSATFNLIVAPIGSPSLVAPVNLSIGGMPTGATAVFAPPTVAAGSSNTPITLTVTAPPIDTSSVKAPKDASPWHRTAPAFLALLLLPVGMLSRRRKHLTRLLMLLVGLCVTTGLSGCLSDATTGYYAQPPETYTLTVSGTSGTLVHSVQVKLTVE